MEKEMFSNEQLVFVAEAIFKTILCVILVGIIGYNREKKGMVVGVRTHEMVGLAGLLIQLTAMEYCKFNGGNNDVFRLAGQYISGIGFVGAGAILKDRRSVKGLTTAASICLSAVVGLAIGAGVFFSSILITIIAYAFLSDWLHLKKTIRGNRSGIYVNLELEIEGNVKEVIESMNDTLRLFGVEIVKIEVNKEDSISNVRLKISVDDEVDINDILADMISVDSITKVRLIEN